MNLKISVAMCTFNGSRFLPAQLESIANQNRQPDELVIYDDRSSDDSVAIAEEFAGRVRFRIRVIKNDEHLGSTKGFEKVISQTGGDVVVLSDQDDIWNPRKLETIECAFLSRPTPAAVFSDAELVDQDGTPTGARLWESFSFSQRERRRFASGGALQVLLKHPVVTGATLAFRREYVDFLLPIPPNHVHDSWMSFLLAACGPILPISDPLIQYRHHSNQQIGPGNKGLRARFEQACRTGPDFYLGEVQRFRQLEKRLEERGARFPHAAVALSGIRKKISHREHRARLPRASVARISKVLREILNGGYWHYSEGWQSVAKDVAGVIAAGDSVERA